MSFPSYPQFEDTEINILTTVWYLLHSVCIVLSCKCNNLLREFLCDILYSKMLLARAISKEAAESTKLYKVRKYLAPTALTGARGASCFVKTTRSAPQLWTELNSWHAQLGTRCITYFYISVCIFALFFPAFFVVLRAIVLVGWPQRWWAIIPLTRSRVIEVAAVDGVEIACQIALYRV